MAKLFNILAIVSVVGAHVISINLNLMQLSLYRGLLALTTILFIVSNLMKYKNIRIKYFKGNRYVIFFNFYWLFYAIISLLWVKDYEAWLKSIFFIGSGAFVVILMIYFLNDEKKIIQVFNSLFLMVIINNLIGWYEIITSNYFFLDSSNASYYGYYKMPVSMLGNANDFGLLMLFGVFLSIIIYLNSQRSIVKIISIITVLSSILLCAYANSRANLLGIILGLATFLIIKLSKEKTRKKIRILFLTTYAIVIFFILSEFMPNSFLSERIYFSFGQEGGSDLLRLNLIRNGFAFLFKSIGFGTGAGNIEYWMMNKNVYDVSNITNIHNWWLEILVGYGIIIFVGYLIMYTTIFRKLFIIYKETDNYKFQNISLGVLAIMVGFILGSISSSSNINKEWLWFFWGLIITFINYYDIKQNLVHKKARCEKLD